MMILTRHFNCSYEGCFINILKDGKETLNTEDLKSFEKAMTDFVLKFLEWKMKKFQIAVMTN
jgi:hypothetical protein